MLRVTGRFQARSADDTIFTIVERRVVMTDIFDGEKRERLGAYDYTLENGDDVSALGEDEFEIVTSSLKIYRID